MYGEQLVAEEALFLLTDLVGFVGVVTALGVGRRRDREPRSGCRVGGRHHVAVGVLTAAIWRRVWHVETAPREAGALVGAEAKRKVQAPSGR